MNETQELHVKMMAGRIEELAEEIIACMRVLQQNSLAALTKEQVDLTFQNALLDAHEIERTLTTWHARFPQDPVKAREEVIEVIQTEAESKAPADAPGIQEIVDLLSTVLTDTLREVKQAGEHTLVLPLEAFASEFALDAATLREALLTLCDQGRIHARKMQDPAHRGERWEVGLIGRLRHTRNPQESRAALTWGNYPWPEWVPPAIRWEIERFWDERAGRGPFQWMENAAQNRAPALGSWATLQRMKRGINAAGREEDYEHCRGRYVHCWNTIGRLVHEDGSFSSVAVGHPEDSIEQYAEDPGKEPTDARPEGLSSRVRIPSREAGGRFGERNDAPHRRENKSGSDDSGGVGNLHGQSEESRS